MFLGFTAFGLLNFGYRYLDNLARGIQHTFATRLMMHTGNLKIVQEACGHANITMTARYAHVSQNDLATAMAGLNRL